jgi:hypothetical protein
MFGCFYRASDTHLDQWFNFINTIINLDFGMARRGSGCQAALLAVNFAASVEKKALQLQGDSVTSLAINYFSLFADWAHIFVSLRYSLATAAWDCVQNSKMC